MAIICISASSLAACAFAFGDSSISDLVGQNIALIGSWFQLHRYHLEKPMLLIAADWVPHSDENRSGRGLYALLFYLVIAYVVARAALALFP
ncbi:MAG TPA: hypothetical protein VGE57_09060 [Solimonas sp.]